jgi:phage shock protein C
MDLKHKKLHRSKIDRIIAGVIGGIAEYLSVDSTALRVAWVILVAFTGVAPGILAYIVMTLVMPEDGHKIYHMPPEGEGK